jgi:hypothetical protein
MKQHSQLYRIALYFRAEMKHNAIQTSQGLQAYNDRINGGVLELVCANPGAILGDKICGIVHLSTTDPAGAFRKPPPPK